MRQTKLVGGHKILNDIDGTERDDRDFDAFHTEGIAEKLFAKTLNPAVELLDGLALHRARCVEKQNARAARFGVFGKLGGGKRLLLVVIVRIVFHKSIFECVIMISRFFVKWQYFFARFSYRRRRQRVAPGVSRGTVNKYHKARERATEINCAILFSVAIFDSLKLILHYSTGLCLWLRTIARCAS